MAETLLRERRYEEAESLCRRTLDRALSEYGSTHLTVAEGLLSVGDPDYTGETTARNLVRAEVRGSALNEGCPCNSMGRLEASRREAEAVAEPRRTRSDESLTLLVGGDATEEAFRQTAPSKRIILLAGHAFVATDRTGAWEPVIPAVGDWDTRETIPPCGLCLARSLPAGMDPAECDGVLTAEEVAAMNLEGCELVVLSACKTGGRYVVSGEGVYGLAGAFRRAGVQTVVCTPWPIDDWAAARFTEEFFHAYLSDGSITINHGRKAATRACIQGARDKGQPGGSFLWLPFVAYQ